MFPYGLLLISAAPGLLGAPPTPPPLAPAEVRPVARPGLGTRLQARLREHGLGPIQRVLIAGIDPSEVAAVGEVTAVLGPVVSARVRGEALLGLARAGALIEAPQPLRPALDVAREASRAEALDEGLDLPTRLRGQGVLVAIYDTGLDLTHPDFRLVGGPSRVVAYWDQGALGPSPGGPSYGRVCTPVDLQSDSCPAGDALGHGTSVMGVLAGNGPQYRGLAPEADLVVARSDDFEGLVDALDWFKTVSSAQEKPLVVNLSLGGQEGPHDGTSLEAQAVDALPYLVVAAAGNDGRLPVHAHLEGPGPSLVALRFPILTTPQLRRAVVDVWSTKSIAAQALLIDREGRVLAKTSTLAPGGAGGTETLGSVGSVLYDAEDGPNPLNQKYHLRFEWRLPDFEDPPAGLGFIALEITGGPADLWVDTPASEPAPVRFSDTQILGAQQVLGDTAFTISDLATAPQSIAVSSYVSRIEFTNRDGKVQRVAGVVGNLSDFSAYGPSLDPERTGEKPELAAPGALIVTARSRQAPEDPPRSVGALYRAISGTSFAAPMVAGTGAALLSGQATLAKAPLKQALVESADPADSERAADPRWGAGRLDAEAAARRVFGEGGGCGCQSVGTDPKLTVLLLLLAVLHRWGRRRTS